MPKRPDWGDQEGSSQRTVASLEQRERKPAPAGLLAESVDEDRKHTDRDDADRRQPAVPAEVTRLRRRASDGVDGKCDTEERERAKRPGPPPKRDPPASHASEQIRQALSARQPAGDDDRCEGRAEQGRSVRRPSPAPLDRVANGGQRECPGPGEPVCEHDERRQRTEAPGRRSAQRPQRSTRCGAACRHGGTVLAAGRATAAQAFSRWRTTV